MRAYAVLASFALIAAGWLSASEVLEAAEVEAAATGTGPGGDWELVWSDEFDGNALDGARWSPDIWAPRKVNDEDQAYTGREKNIRIEKKHHCFPTADTDATQCAEPI